MSEPESAPAPATAPHPELAPDLALTGGTVVTSLDPPTVVSADVVIGGGRILAVGTAPAGVPRRDCSGALVLPGNVCAHHHLYSALARGMPYRLPPPQNFLQILQRVWWRLDRALDEPTVRLSALVGGLDAIRAGTTTVVDHHASPDFIDGSLDVIADALGRLGVRSVLCYEVSDRDGAQRAAAGVAENRRFLAGQQPGGPGAAFPGGPATPETGPRSVTAADRWGARGAAVRYPLSRGLMGAHASFTLSDETLAACAEAAASAGVGVHIHVAEDAADQADALAVHGARVMDRLAAAGILGPGALLAHCIHVTEPEVLDITAAGATVAHNPRSNMNNRVGYSPLAPARPVALGTAGRSNGGSGLGEGGPTGHPGGRVAGGTGPGGPAADSSDGPGHGGSEIVPRVALGTDGIGGDMIGESQLGYFRAVEACAGTGHGWPLARLAEGARLAGRCFGEPLLGRVEPGAPADLTVLSYPAPTPLAAGNLAGHWLFGVSSRQVRDVIVAGELVVADGRSTRVDEAQVAAEAARETARLWQRLEQLEPHPFSPKGG
ncbi:MAG TPA: amidohydrolase family protein [Streptosporangiaceae bacterium]